MKKLLVIIDDVLEDSYHVFHNEQDFREWIKKDYDFITYSDLKGYNEQNYLTRKDGYRENFKIIWIESHL